MRLQKNSDSIYEAATREAPDHVRTGQWPPNKRFHPAAACAIMSRRG
jgi:hypothetical protein